MAGQMFRHWILVCLTCNDRSSMPARSRVRSSSWRSPRYPAQFIPRCSATLLITIVRYATLMRDWFQSHAALGHWREAFGRSSFLGSSDSQYTGRRCFDDSKCIASALFDGMHPVHRPQHCHVRITAASVRETMNAPHLESPRTSTSTSTSTSSTEVVARIASSKKVQQ